MLLIRGFEQRVSALYRDGEVPGFVHLSIGQEATAVGACWPLRPADVITSTHRGHGHCLAKGLDPLGMFAELMGKDEGTNRGRGGSMHIADPKLGIFGANGIVAAGVPIAVGAATAAQLRADGGVAVAFFGDGAPAQGAFHEALNLAAVWRLPGGLLLREQRLRRVLRRRPTSTAPRSSSAPRGTASAYVRGRRQRRRGRRGGDGRRRGERPRRAGPDRRGGRRPTAGTGTTRATRSATARPRSSRSGRPTTRSFATARVLRRRRRHRRRARRARVGRGRRARCGGRRGPRPGEPRPSARWATSSSRPRADRAGAARPSPPTHRCSARWTPSDRRSKPSWRPTIGCSSPASTSAPAATSSVSCAGWPTSSRGACATRRSPRRRSSASAWARRWPGCARWSRSCTSTSSASASTSCSTRRPSCRS